MASPHGEYDARRYWTERLESDFSLVGVGYKALGERFNRWQYRAYLRNLERAERRFGFDLGQDSILECGFGTGYFVDYYHGRGNRDFAGVDLTEICVQQLQARYPDADFRRVDLGAGTLDLGRKFDVATAFAVLLHITDDACFRQAVGNICRHSADWVLISDIFPRHRFAAPGRSHYVLRSRGEYERALAEQGFEIVGTEPIFVLLSAPSPTPRWWFYAWNGVLYLGCRSEFTGHLLGGLLYAVDGLLMRLFGWQPSARLLVARRRG
jgi:2-polyprenyl-3-methyl-5-hydroxy-6-metoxy-1,4-benzoquinol methylase